MAALVPHLQKQPQNTMNFSSNLTRMTKEQIKVTKCQLHNVAQLLLGAQILQAIQRILGTFSF